MHQQVTGDLDLRTMDKMLYTSPVVLNLGSCEDMRPSDHKRESFPHNRTIAQSKSQFVTTKANPSLSFFFFFDRSPDAFYII